MTDLPRSDALVLLGATGDLARKKLFLSLHALAGPPSTRSANSSPTRQRRTARQLPPGISHIGLVNAAWAIHNAEQASTTEDLP